MNTPSFPWRGATVVTGEEAFWFVINHLRNHCIYTDSGEGKGRLFHPMAWHSEDYKKWELGYNNCRFGTGPDGICNDGNETGCSYPEHLICVEGDEVMKIKNYWHSDALATLEKDYQLQKDSYACKWVLEGSKSHPGCIDLAIAPIIKEKGQRKQSDRSCFIYHLPSRKEAPKEEEEVTDGPEPADKVIQVPARPCQMGNKPLEKESALALLENGIRAVTRQWIDQEMPMILRPHQDINVDSAERMIGKETGQVVEPTEAGRLGTEPATVTAFQSSAMITDQTQESDEVSVASKPATGTLGAVGGTAAVGAIIGAASAGPFSAVFGAAVGALTNLGLWATRLVIHKAMSAEPEETQFLKSSAVGFMQGLGNIWGPFEKMFKEYKDRQGSTPKNITQFGGEALPGDLDLWIGAQYICDPSAEATKDGLVVGWKLYVSQPFSKIALQVWRCVEGEGDHFLLVGESVLTPNVSGLLLVSLEEGERFFIKKGDTLGFYYPYTSVVPFQILPDNEGTTMRYVEEAGDPSWERTKVGSKAQFVQSDIHEGARAYSFSALVLTD